VISKTSTLEDVCFEVAEALDLHGFTAVLTGGSAASMYAPNAYMSQDADFVLQPDVSLATVAEALSSIGFVRHGRSKEFVHAETSFTVEFSRGPLAVGGVYARTTFVLERGGRRLRTLTSTDSVRDRLAAYYHWNDLTALNVAVAATRHEEIDMRALRDWTERDTRPPR